MRRLSNVYAVSFHYPHMSDVEIAPETSALGSFLPRPRIDRHLRRQLAPRRVSAGLSAYTAGALDALFRAVIEMAHVEATAARKKRIGKLSLMKAVRSNPDIARVFANYTFFSTERLRYDAMNLMTKADRIAVTKKRQEAKKGKNAKNGANDGAENVPEVDEE